MQTSSGYPVLMAPLSDLQHHLIIIYCGSGAAWAQLGGSQIGSFRKLQSAWLELESFKGPTILDVQDGALTWLAFDAGCQVVAPLGLLTRASIYGLGFSQPGGWNPVASV